MSLRLFVLAALALLSGAPALTGCDSFDPTELGPNCTCACFSTSAQADRYVEAYPASRGDLDADGDGRACEALG